MAQKHHKLKSKNATRAKYHCSPELKVFMRKANLVKNDIPPFDGEDELTNLGLDMDVYFDFIDYVKRLPREIQSFLTQSEDFQNLIQNYNLEDESFIYEMVKGYKAASKEILNLSNQSSKNIRKWEDYEFSEDVYETFIVEGVFCLFYELKKILNLRRFFEAITELNESVDSDQGVNDLYDSKLSPARHKLFKIQDFLGLKLSLDQKGNLKLDFSELANAINGINTKRIRLCEVCENVFWAYRKDSFACSKKHAKVRQMRRLRKNWKEKGDLYLNARKKKAKKRKEKKVNGSL